MEKKSTPELSESEQLKIDFPSIELAYPIAINSYEILSKRNDAIDTKIQNSLTVFVTFFVAIITLAKIQELKFDAWLFYVAFGFFVISAGINLYSRIHGNLKTLSPAVLFEKYLADDELLFQKDLIYYAGEAYLHNNKMIAWKWRFHVASIAAFAISVMLLVLWVAHLT